MKKPVQVFNFSIQNAGNDAVDIHIDGDIVDASTQAMIEAWFGDTTSVSFKSFRNQINSNPVQTYNIYINSPGGLVTDAMAMHDFLIDLQNQGKTVNTIGRGIVASAATYILMAGKNASMSKNSWFMIHNVSGGMYGDVNTMERYVGMMRQFNDSARDFYAGYTQMRKEDITKLMNNETWMAADEAKEKGFIKSVTGDASFTNSIKNEDWVYSNQSILNSYNAAVKPVANTSNQSDDMKKLFTDFTQTILNAIKGVKVDDKTDNQTLVNNIAEAVSNSFSGLGEQMEAAVGEAVTNAMAGEALTNAVKAAVDSATGELTTKITNLETAKTELEKKNGELEQEITNKLGGASTTKNEKDEVEAVGSFK